MSEKLASEEDRQKIVKALKAGRIKLSAHGQEYFDRAGVIKGGNDADWAIVDVKVHFWGKWHKEKDGETFGNDGGMEICWQTVSAGFGSLTIFIKDGKLQAETEGMSKEFCNTVFAKVIESWMEEE